MTLDKDASIAEPSCKSCAATLSPSEFDCGFPDCIGGLERENMRIAKEVRHGELIPKWYGVAWVRWEVDAAICYPMPLNLIVAAVRAVAIWMRYGYRAVPYNARDAYAQGLRDGKRSNE